MTRLFVEACASGDLRGLLSEDVVFYSDGGGKVVTARNPVYGPDRIARLMLGLAHKRWPGYTIRLAAIGGRPGIICYSRDRPDSVLALEIAGGRIRVSTPRVKPRQVARCSAAE
jgi:hypothetical protein